MADVMTVEKSTQDIHPSPGTVDLTKRVKLYAPKGAPYHTEGQEVNIGAALEAKFRSLGFTDKAPAKGK